MLPRRRRLAVATALVAGLVGATAHAAPERKPRLTLQLGQAAVEDSSLGQVVFTHALVTGPEGAADLDADRAVSVRELVTDLESEVSPISRERFKGEQLPVTHGTGRNFPLALPR